MYYCIVLTHDPGKQASPHKPTLRGTLPINSLLTDIEQPYPGEI